MAKRNKEILISKMFVGEYNEENIGHEVINFFKPDGFNDKSYLYIAPYGKIDKLVKNVILIGPSNGFAYPVLGVAIDVTPFDMNESKRLKGKVKYGGKKIEDIRFDDKFTVSLVGGAQDLSCSVPKGELYKPKGNNVFLIPNKLKKGQTVKEVKARLNGEYGNNAIFIEGYNPNRQFCYGDDKGNAQDIINSINNKKLWELYPLDPINLKTGSAIKDTFLKFCNREYEETLHSNMLYNLFKDNDDLCSEFISYLIGRNYAGQDFHVEKEFQALTYWQKLVKNYYGSTTGKTKGNEEVFKSEFGDSIKLYSSVGKKLMSNNGRIDLFIYNEDYLLVIENKIKSGINSFYTNVTGEISNQLDKYIEFIRYAQKYGIFPGDKGKYSKATPIFKIFAPNYLNCVNYKDFEVLRYNAIQDFFSKSLIYKAMKLKPLYNRYEFNFALEKHSRTREEEITKRFINEILK